MKFPVFPKRKVDSLSNGVFLVFLGILLYTEQWWPGILFALMTTFALRQYLTGKRVTFFITLCLIALLSIVMINGKAVSMFFPLIFIGGGILLIFKEIFSLKNMHAYWNSDEHFKE
jgi:hypothetical protein